jgi:hypothetical protein
VNEEGLAQWGVVAAQKKLINILHLVGVIKEDIDSRNLVQI